MYLLSHLNLAFHLYRSLCKSISSIYKEVFLYFLFLLLFFVSNIFQIIDQF